MKYDPIDRETYLECGDRISARNVAARISQPMKAIFQPVLEKTDDIEYFYYNDKDEREYEVTYQWDKRSEHHGEMYIVGYHEKEDISL